MKKWLVLNSELVFDTKWYKVRRDHVRTETGKEFDDYYLGAQPDFINLVALFDNGDVLLERQYKHGLGEISLETVGGVVEKGESPLECAKRELLEETGYEASQIEQLGVVNENPTRTVSRTYLFLATGLKKIQDSHIDYNESDIEFDRMPLGQYIEQIQKGNVLCEPAITAIFFVCLRLGLVKLGEDSKIKKRTRLFKLFNFNKHL